MDAVKVEFHPLTPKAASRFPSKSTDGAAGWDIQANLVRDVCLKPGERALIPTGFALTIPEGFEAQLRPRSGWAYRTGVSLLNSPGTIDSDYRGEIKVLLINLGDRDVWIKDGDRIAQLVFGKVQSIMFATVDKITETSRGNRGFGHSGR